MMLRKTTRTRSTTGPTVRASMRPQHDAAENVGVALGNSPGGVASMRPQHDAAENLQSVEVKCNRFSRFNEAAA